MKRVPHLPPMIKVPDVGPKSAFNCPRCGAYARQNRRAARSGGDRHVAAKPVIGWWFVFCEHCGKESVWFRDRMIYPDISDGPPPNPDLPEDIHADYLEAQSIVGRSPRGAAALLRLCIQKLCKHPGEKGEDINTDIKNLVKKGLPMMVQQALDAVRVIGNEAVHPGQMDLKDDRQTAETLFNLVNLVAQRMISDPKQVQAVYDGLPKSAREKIAKRDQIIATRRLTDEEKVDPGQSGS